MPDGYVSREELTAHLDPIRDDIAEIKSDVKLIIGRSWLGARGRDVVDNVVPIVLVTAVSAGLTELISYLA